MKGLLVILSTCHASICSLKNANDGLNARIEKLNASSSLEHVSVSTRCKDHDFDVCIDHASTIAKLNDEIAHLNGQPKTCKNEVEKDKFARDSFTICIHPSIKGGLGLHGGAKKMKSQKAPNFTKEKWKAPMASSLHPFHDKNHDFIYTYVKNANNAHHDVCNDRPILPMRYDTAFAPRTMIASSSYSYAHSRSRSRHRASHVVSHAPKDRNSFHGPSIIYHTFDATNVLYCKNDRIVTSNVGPKCKKGKTCIWVQNHM
jgi:hypothetical protein